MTRRIRSYWSKYIQLYRRGILGIITFIGITVVIISILATIASRGMGVIFNGGNSASDHDARDNYCF